MIVVRVELWSAITGKVTELARMCIANSGDTANPNFGDYHCMTLKGRSKDQLDKAMRSGSSPQRAVEVKHHARLREHVWNLVAKALTGMEYGK